MTSIFGPRVIPRRSAVSAPFGGGSLASSSVIRRWLAQAADDMVIALAAQTTINARQPIRSIIPPPATLKLHSARAAIPDDRVRRPKQGMSVGEFGLAVGTHITRAVHQRHHGQPQGFGPGQFRGI